ADDVVALLYEQRDEAASENAGRARDEDPLRLHLCYASGSWKRPAGAAGTAPASGKLTKLRRAGEAERADRSVLRRDRGGRRRIPGNTPRRRCIVAWRWRRQSACAGTPGTWKE